MKRRERGLEGGEERQEDKEKTYESSRMTLILKLNRSYGKGKLMQFQKS